MKIVACESSIKRGEKQGGEYRHVRIPLRVSGRWIGRKRTSRSAQQIKAQLQRHIYAPQFLAGNGSASAQQARLLDGHDLLAFDIGVVGQAILRGGSDTYVQ